MVSEATIRPSGQGNSFAESLVDYQREHGILGIDEKQNIVTAKLNELNNQLTQAQADRIQKQAVYELAKSGSLESVPAMADSKVIQHLKDQQADLSNQLALLSSQYGPAHPKVVTVRDQLRQVENSIQAEGKTLVSRLNSQYLEAVDRERMLTSALDQQKGEANQLNENSIGYDNLKHKADARPATI